MAAPSYWNQVLQQFPDLKINLGHFGGLGEWEALSKGRHPKKQWIDPIIDLMRTYDHVYTDFSYNHLPTTPHAQAYKRILLQKIHGLEHKILFGTDYYMSRMLCDLDDFVEGYQDLLPDLFEKAAGENAVNFLRSEASKNFFPDFFKKNNSKLKNKYRSLFL
jgi:predicted TIM-barrel fold metal-dependent hydrolase